MRSGVALERQSAGRLAVADLKRVVEAADAAFSANTRRTYREYAGQFRDWLEARDLEPGDETVAAWLTSRFDDGLAPSSLRVASSAVGAVAKAAGRPDPRGELSRRVLAGLVRLGGDRGQGQARGLRRADALAAAGAARADGGLRGARDAALILVMSDALLRVSEAAAVRVDDVTFSGEGSGRLTIRRSKTDQEARGAVAYLTRRTTAAVKEWLRCLEDPAAALAERIESGECRLTGGRLGNERKLANVLRARRGDRLFEVCSATVARILKERARRIGIEGISGHSARVGSAQSLTTRGAALHALMQAGRWRKADTAARYVAGERAALGAVAQLFEDG